jgi:cyclin-dependent kinase 7
MILIQLLHKALFIILVEFISGQVKMAANRYVKGRQLGEGTWGVVYEGFSKADNSLVAIKRIRPMVGKEKGIYGVNFSALREIKYLKEIKHDYIIQLLDVYISDGALHLVFEYCVSDLEHVYSIFYYLSTPY